MVCLSTRFTGAALGEFISINHRIPRGTKRKNTFQSRIRTPSLTRALISAKNKLSNQLNKRNSKKKSGGRGKKSQRVSSSRPKLKSQRGNKVRGIIQDILHRPQRTKEQRKKKPKRINNQHVRNKRRNKNRKRPKQGHRSQQQNAR